MNPEEEDEEPSEEMNSVNEDEQKSTVDEDKPKGSGLCENGSKSHENRGDEKDARRIFDLSIKKLQELNVQRYSSSLHRTVLLTSIVQKAKDSVGDADNATIEAQYRAVPMLKPLSNENRDLQLIPITDTAIVHGLEDEQSESVTAPMPPRDPRPIDEAKRERVKRRLDFSAIEPSPISLEPKRICFDTQWRNPCHAEEEEDMDISECGESSDDETYADENNPVQESKLAFDFRHSLNELGEVFPKLGESNPFDPRRKAKSLPDLRANESSSRKCSIKEQDKKLQKDVTIRV